MDIDTHTDLETKAGIPLDAMVTHGEMMRAFEAFKDANDERLALGEKRSGDVVLEEKLARLNSTLDAQARRRHRAARSLYRQALRAVLHHQARGRRRTGLRRIKVMKFAAS